MIWRHSLVTVLGEAVSSWPINGPLPLVKLPRVLGNSRTWEVRPLEIVLRKAAS